MHCWDIIIFFNTRLAWNLLLTNSIIILIINYLLAGSKQWIKATIFGTAICSAVFVYVLSEEEHAYHRNPYPYAHIRSKKYPWADGDSELFMLLGRKLGRTYGEDHKEDHE